MRIFRKPERVEFHIQHGEHTVLKASGPGVDVLPTVTKWLADNPATPKPKEDEPKIFGTGFSNTERRANYEAADAFKTNPD
jgi:hypothetical protein